MNVIKAAIAPLSLLADTLTDPVKTMKA